MYIDKQLVLSDEQAITGDAISTNVVDAVATNLGDGEDLRLVVLCTTAFDNLTSLDIKLRSDDNAAHGSPTTHSTTNVLLAGLTAGARLIDMPLPRGLERYIALYYDVNGTNPAAGKVSAMIVKDSRSSKQYASGYTV